MFYAPTLSKERARELLTIAGGEVFNDDTGIAATHHTALVTIHWARVFSFSVFVALALLPVFRRKKRAEHTDRPVDATEEDQHAETRLA